MADVVAKERENLMRVRRMPKKRCHTVDSEGTQDLRGVFGERLECPEHLVKRLQVQLEVLMRLAALVISLQS
jgi:hypothetical protein